MEKCLAVGEVPIQGGDTDTGPLRNRVSGRFPADLKDELDRGVEEPLPVPSGVGSLQRLPRVRRLIAHKTEYIPPLRTERVV